MNAIQKARKIVADKKANEEAAIRNEKARRREVENEGERLYEIVRDVVNQFKEDFVITKIVGAYAWKIRIPENWREPRRPKEIYVVLEYTTGMVRYSDDTDEQEVSSWDVTVQVPGPYMYTGYMREGSFNRVLQKTVVQIWSSGVNEKFSDEFGEFMARWYV